MRTFFLSLGQSNRSRCRSMARKFVCTVCLTAGAASYAYTGGQQPATAQQPASVQNPGQSSSSGAAYRKYLQEERDVNRYQRKQERREEIQQRKVDNPEAEDGENVYRHSTMVKRLGQTFGMSTETTARIFEIVNFLILAAAVLWFIARALPKTLRDRKERIQNELQQARVATDDANRRLADVEQRLRRLDEDIRSMRTEAEQETIAEEQRLRAALEQERHRILDAAAEEVSAASRNAQRQLKNLAADLVIDHARRRANVTGEADRALVAEFVSGLGSRNGRGDVN